ncbi:hypothetical protein [Pseudomonas sp. BN414]|nr:hypothetical protein [Pseudomonas sp. BN414]
MHRLGAFVSTFSEKVSVFVEKLRLAVAIAANNSSFLMEETRPRWP